MTTLPAARPRAPAPVPQPPGVPRAPTQALLSRLPSFERLEGAGGLRIALVERPEFPVVHLTLTVPAGGLYDSHGRAGVAAMIPLVLRDDAERRLSERFEAMGATPAPHVDWQAASFSIGVLAGDAEPALEALLEAVGRRSFPVPLVEAARRRALAALNGAALAPRELARRRLDRALYGDGPYGRPLAGDPRDLAATTAGDLEEFHRRWYGARSAMLLAIGRFRVESLLRRLDGLAGRLPDAPRPADPEPPEPRRPAARVLIVDRPGAAQTALALGQASVRRDDPDADRVPLLAGVLGGGAHGRLNRRLRAERGYTYHVQSLLLQRAGRCLFTVDGSVRSDCAGESLRIVLEEIERLRREPVPEPELGWVKNRQAGYLLRSLQTNRELAAQMVRLLIHGFPEGYFQEYLRRVDDATPARLLELARRHLRPRDLVVVAVGPAASLRRQLGFHGEVEVIGEPVPATTNMVKGLVRGDRELDQRLSDERR